MQRLRLLIPVNAQAYKAYLEGEYFRNKGGEDNLNKSINLFKKAIEIDRSYAQAYAGMAESYIVLGIVGIRPPKEVYQEAKAAATKVVELDDTLAAAHNALADISLGLPDSLIYC